MKTTMYMLLIILAASSGLSAQTEKVFINKPNQEIAFDFGAFTTPLFSKNMYGVNIDAKYYLQERFASGLSVSIAKNRIGTSFSYPINQALINYMEVGWINQYDFFHSKRIRAGLNLNNGILLSQLCDNSLKEMYLTKYGYQERPVKIATNYLGFVEPGLDVSFRVFANKHNPDVYLTTKAKYRFVYGSTKYANSGDYSNYYFGAGISLIGFTGS